MQVSNEERVPSELEPTAEQLLDAISQKLWTALLSQR